MPCMHSNGTVEGLGGVYVLAFQATLDILMLMLIASTNTFIVFSVLSCRISKSSELWISRASSRFIVNLALADLWVAITTVYYFSFHHLCFFQIHLGHQRWPCLLRFFLLTNSLLTSACSMAAIAIDRYIAVVYALRYRELLNYRRSTFMIAFVWCFPVVASSSVLYWNNWSPDIKCEVEEVLPFAYVCLVGISTHGLIISVVAGTHYRIHREALEINNRRRSQESGSAIFSSSETISNKRPSVMNSKSARTVLLVTGCYLTCWTPYTILYLISEAGYTHPVFAICYNFSHTFANLNYMVNPFIYAWRNASVKYAIVRTCKRLGMFKSSFSDIISNTATVHPINKYSFPER